MNIEPKIMFNFIIDFHVCSRTFRMVLNVDKIAKVQSRSSVKEVCGCSVLIKLLLRVFMLFCLLAFITSFRILAVVQRRVRRSVI